MEDPNKSTNKILMPMNIDAIHIQGAKAGNKKKKQKAKGHCFLCNKQGYLKRDCPVKGTES